jgi:hypothetical protein
MERLYRLNVAPNRGTREAQRHSAEALEAVD